MIGDVLRGLGRVLVFEIGGDAGGAKGMVADPRLDAGVPGAALNHPIGVLLPHGVFGERAGLASRYAESRSVVVAGDAGGRDSSRS